MKYNLSDLHWQEFEVLSFKCLIEVVSPNVKFIEGGSDKGREIVFTGTSSEFRSDLSGSWVFQCKHKSGDLGPARNKLKNDLEGELKKVFITNKHKFDNYILITNITLTGGLRDELQKIFDEFIEDNPDTCKNFDVFSYREFEQVIEKTSGLVWQYPKILSHPDFELLFNYPFKKITDTRIKGWVKGISERRGAFVHTEQTDNAIKSLEKNNIIILTGPAKSGKTFNAEMLALYFVGNDNFEAIKIDEPDEVEKFYVSGKKQIFVCDDAFGSHVLSFQNADDWDRKLETIFNLSDSEHKFVFSSRENIYNAFKNYAKDFNKEFLPQTTISSEKLTDPEKRAILFQYVKLSSLEEPLKQEILNSEDLIVNHPNFSPETVRAFFSNQSVFISGGGILYKLLEHLKKPDAYLGKLFYNLNKNSQAAVLSVLCALESDYTNVQKKFAQLRVDLGIRDLKPTITEFEELDGAIIKVIKSQEVEAVDFYHPSMQEFLIREIEKDRNGILRKIILMNLNATLVNQFILDLPLTKKVRRELKAIEIKIEDVNLIKIGLDRVLSNEQIRFYNIIPLIKWLSEADTSNSKLFAQELFSELRELVNYIYNHIFTDKIYRKLQNESAEKWMNFLLILRTLELVTGCKPTDDVKRVIVKLINDKRSDSQFWRIALLGNVFLDEKEFHSEVGKTWLEDFGNKLVEDIYSLGNEQYGSYFPDVEAYRKNLKRLGLVEEKLNTRKYWYPKFLICQTKINLLKQSKSRTYNSNLLLKISKEWGVLLKISTTAKNRHHFNVAQRWWEI